MPTPCSGPQEGTLITSMTNQALKRLGISTLKGQRLREVIDNMGYSESCEFLECMQPQIVAEMMMEHMEIDEAATQLKMISGEARSAILQAGTAEWREKILGLMDMADAGSANFICPRCGYKSPNDMSFSEQAAHLSKMSPEAAAKLLMEMMDSMDPDDFARLLLALDPPMQGEQASDVLAEMIFAGKGEKIKKDIHPAMGNIDAPKTKIIFDLLEDKKKNRKKKKGQGATPAAFDQNFMELDCANAANADGQELPPITPPESWLTFLGASNMAEMQKMWKKDGNKLLQVTKLRSLVVKIYQAKIEADINNMRAGKFRYPLVDYVVMYFDTFFGLKQLAQQNLLRALFTLKDLYPKKQDPLLCTFVQLCGIYHPLPIVQTNIVLDLTVLVAGCIAGGGKQFTKPSSFWQVWGAGKEVLMAKEIVDQVLDLIFINGTHQPSNKRFDFANIHQIFWDVVAHMKIPVVPEGMSVGNCISAVLAVHRKILDSDKDFIMQIMKEKSVNDKVPLESFMNAVAEMSPHIPMNEGTVAFIFSRAISLDNRIVMQKVSAIQKGSAIMDSPEVHGKTPSVDCMVAAFNWNYSIYCAGGVRTDGSYLVEEFRQKAKGTEQVLGGGAKKDKKK